MGDAVVVVAVHNNMKGVIAHKRKEISVRSSKMEAMASLRKVMYVRVMCRQHTVRKWEYPRQSK
jgi:hypothetical protein